MNIFVGNLSFLATESDVKSIFEAFGTVSAVSIKKKSGKNSRGFGFVTMPDDIQAEAAILKLQDKDFMGRPMSVSVQRPKPVKPKKNYKEMKRISRLQKQAAPAVVFSAPTIHEKEIKPKIDRKPFKKFEKSDKPSRKVYDEDKKFSQPLGAQAWEKRKGRGTAKPWKKRPGGVNKKFKYAR